MGFKKRRQTVRILGKNLRVGDVIEVGYGRRDTITALKPYTGTYRNSPEFAGCRLADFAQSKVGMTILAGDVFTIFGLKDKKRAMNPV